MTGASPIDKLEISIGGLTRSELMERLRARGILLNAHAETLLDEEIFNEQAVRVITVTERTVADLGRPAGASLSEIFQLARAAGLLLCPADAAPYLRLKLEDQATSADSVMSSGRAPAGSLTVAAEPLSDDDDYPKGFYLRVADGQPWLRGYCCDDEHTWSPDDRFVFQLPRESV